MQSELTMKVVQNEALMKALMKAFSMSTELKGLLDVRLAQAIKGLNLVDQGQFEELRAEIDGLHQEILELRLSLDQRLEAERLLKQKIEHLER